MTFKNIMVKMNYGMKNKFLPLPSSEKCAAMQHPKNWEETFRNI